MPQEHSDAYSSILLGLGEIGILSLHPFLPNRPTILYISTLWQPFSDKQRTYLLLNGCPDYTLACLSWVLLTSRQILSCPLAKTHLARWRETWDGTIRTHTLASYIISTSLLPWGPEVSSEGRKWRITSASQIFHLNPQHLNLKLCHISLEVPSCLDWKRSSRCEQVESGGCHNP